jgi:hypothetical protein
VCALLASLTSSVDETGVDSRLPLRNQVGDRSFLRRSNNKNINLKTTTTTTTNNSRQLIVHPNSKQIETHIGGVRTTKLGNVVDETEYRVECQRDESRCGACKRRVRSFCQVARHIGFVRLFFMLLLLLLLLSMRRC